MSTVLNPPSTPIAASRPHAATSLVELPRYVWAITRLGLGWTFLWPFLDKTFGLGHETVSAKSWINGGSPTSGFLSGAEGPFAAVYHSLAGSRLADWGFMLGLLGIGMALLLGIGTRVAAASGAVLLMLMWSASLPPANNPFLDDHIIYSLVLVGLAAVNAGDTLGFGRRWTSTELVRRHTWLA